MTKSEKQLKKKLPKKIESQAEYFDIKKLVELQDNPRKITKKDFDDLIRNIKADVKFLEVRPVLVNHVDGIFQVYAGNQRLKACLYMGWDEIPVIIENNLTKDLMRERAIKDNVNRGKWDGEKVEPWRAVIEEVHVPEIKFKEEEEEGEVHFATELLEAQNYIVFAFDNIMDWQVIEDFFKLEKAKGKRSDRYSDGTTGIGRVIDGNELLKSIGK